MAVESDIDNAYVPKYYPDYERFIARQRCKDDNSSTEGRLPPELPDHIQSQMNWQGQNLQEESYLLRLTEKHLQEIDEACHQSLRSVQNIGDISRENFSLPTLGNILETSRAGLHTGNGLLLLRGLDPSRYSRRENVCIFVGLSRYLSETAGIQFGGKRLGHIKDLASIDQLNELNRCAAPYCNVELPMHTDSGDVVAMFVLSPTAEGGQGTFASVAAIYNELAESDPELLPLLFKDDWPMDRPPDRKGLDGNGLYYRRPVMFINNGAPEMVFSRGAIIRSPRGLRPPNVPNVTKLQHDALDAMHFAAMKHIHRVEYESGDFLFFNNRKLIHGRDSFRDGPGKVRHMLRLWLEDPPFAGPAPHPALRLQWDKVFRSDAAGSDAQQWPMEPERL